ncbi:hypothetical protein KR038_002724 [Drosophila bunnanda]|nr:hypothetical protein KR038_002724 [Drosophila bunnanda]
MCDISEYALDRQFATQVRALGEVYEDNISCQDFELSQHWLQVFQEVKTKAKYARNGLMLLLISQLREMGRLGKPFVDIKNMCRPLDDVLNEYDGKMDGELEFDALEMDTNASTSGSGSSRCSSEVLKNDRQAEEPNREVFKEANVLFVNTLETEKHYTSRYLKLEKDLSKKAQTGKQEKIWQATIRAIDRLKDWTEGSQKIDFLATCFEPFLENEPVISGQIHELDRRLEVMLDDVVKQATERSYKNMRIMYSCVFQHQKNCCKVRLKELEKSEKWLNEEKQKLRGYAEDLKRREDQLQRHEAIAVQVVKCPDPEKLLLLSPRTPGCEHCQNEKVAQKNRSGCYRRRSSKSRCVQEPGKLSDEPSDLPDGKQL